MNPLGLIPAPYRLIGVALILAALVTGIYGYGYSKGHKRATEAAAAEKLASVKQAIEQAQLIAKQDAEVAAANIKTVERIRTVTRTIHAQESRHATANPLPVNCVNDATRMRNINAALANNIAADPGKPDYRLPTATSAGGP